MHRFYVPDSFEADVVELMGDEAAHLQRVLRLSIGERVTLFDGKGRAVVAEIEDVRKRSARLRIRERPPIETGAGLEITLVTAVPKSDRFRWLVEKATELGVTRLIPVRTERSVVHPGDGKIQKMKGASIAACKQCGRNDLLTIEPLQDWADVLGRSTSKSLLVADLQGRPLREVPLPDQEDRGLMLAVGPEGGFTPAEVKLAQDARGELVELGPSILRIETAAIAMVAWVRMASVR